MQKIATGGPLNALNEHFKCNSRARTVAVMALLEKHPTDDPEVLRKTIEDHSFGSCDCGVRSTGPVEKFALSLYEAQFQTGAEEWLKRHGRHDYARCLSFQVALFCEAPIRGRLFEYRSRNAVTAALREAYPSHEWSTRHATSDEDAGMAIDYFVLEGGNAVAGIQVKPQTAMTRHDTVQMNRQKMKKFDGYVAFHVYDSHGAFADTSDIAERCEESRREKRP